MRLFSGQIHRRGRALRKLAKQLCEGHVVMTPRSLQNYIMPYAMTALLDEKMQKVTGALQLGFSITLKFVVLTSWVFLSFRQHENMISASVEVVGAVCRRLTWSKYLYYLKHFIHILQTAQTEQKLAVRSAHSRHSTL